MENKDLLRRITHDGEIRGHYDKEENLESFDILYDGKDYHVAFLRSLDNTNLWTYRILKEGKLIAEGEYTKL